MMSTEPSLPAFENEACPVAPTTSATDADGISLLDLLIEVAKRKTLIFKITAVSAALSIVLSLVLPNRYTATVLLLPPQQNSSLGAQLSAQLGALGSIGALAGGGGGGLLKNANDLYVSMLKSRTVEEAMVNHFGLMQEYHAKFLSDACKAFESHTSIDGSGKDGLIRISVEDHDPKRAAELANGYIEQFRSLSANLAITEAQQRRMFFEQQMLKAKNDLVNAEIVMTETEQKTGLIQLDNQARALIESAVALRAQITAKEVQIQGMETYATGENAQLIQAHGELDGLRAQLSRLGGDQHTFGDNILPAKGQMTASGIEYVRHLRDVKYYETVFEALARQFEIAKLDEAKEGTLIQVVDAAQPPDKRSSPKRARLVLGSTAVGLVAGLLAALLHAGIGHIKEDRETSSKLALLRDSLSIHSH